MYLRDSSFVLLTINCQGANWLSLLLSSGVPLKHKKDTTYGTNYYYISKESFDYNIMSKSLGYPAETFFIDLQHFRKNL